jgi:putative DNA primase/helicase
VRVSPTLLVDEADTFMAHRDDLRNVLNSGYTRSGARVIRCAERTFEPQVFLTWCPKAVALIGRLPDTLESRSIVVKMKRRASHEDVERLRLDRPEPFRRLNRQLARWTADHFEALRAADPSMPLELGDRQADNWRPLLAIADLLGADWGAHARVVALRHSTEVRIEQSRAEQLLADVGSFIHEYPKRIATTDLLRRLADLEDRPWGDWQDGTSAQARALAGLLRGFDIAPHLVRLGKATFRGYESAHFLDAISRYTPTHPLQPLQVNGGTAEPVPPHRSPDRTVTGEAGPSLPAIAGRVTDATDVTASPGDGPVPVGQGEDAGRDPLDMDGASSRGSDA